MNTVQDAIERKLSSIDGASWRDVTVIELHEDLAPPVVNDDINNRDHLDAPATALKSVTIGSEVYDHDLV